MPARIGLLSCCIMLLMLPGPGFGQNKEFSQTVDLEPGGELWLVTDRGSVRLTSWDQNRVEIYARIEAPRDVDRDYAEEAVEATRIDVNVTARSVRIRSNYSDVPSYGWTGQNRRIPDIHYEIRAPRNLNLDVDVDRNRTTIEGIQGAIRIETDRTELDGRDWVGDITLNMDRGELRLTEVRGSLDIKTDRTEVRIDMIGLEGNSRFDADRGNVELRLPEAQGFMLRADVGRRGSFHSDFKITTRSFRDRIIEGAINDGGPELRFRGDRAEFRLRQR